MPGTERTRLAESTDIGFNKAHKSCIRRCIVERDGRAIFVHLDPCQSQPGPAGSIHLRHPSAMISTNSTMHRADRVPRRCTLSNAAD